MMLLTMRLAGSGVGLKSPVALLIMDGFSGLREPFYKCPLRHQTLLQKPSEMALKGSGWNT